MYVKLIKNNQIAQDYWQKYLYLISSKYQYLTEKGYIKFYPEILQDDNLQFRRYGDINSMVNFLYYAVTNGFDSTFYTKDRFKKFANALEQQINYYLKGQINKLVFNQWEKIWNTDIYLTDKDLNPYNVMDTHPDHNWIGVGWWEVDKNKWLEIYNKTFELLSQIDEGVWSELNIMINKIVPLRTAYQRHNSASYKECIGHLYLWLTLWTDTPWVNNIEAIIHESSHNKLNLISHFDKLVLNWGELQYYSPYRPDPRHIWGIFLWIHAFSPTIYYLALGYKKGVLNEGVILEKLYLYHLKNKYALRVLKKYWKFTSLWEQILDEVRQVLSDTDGLFEQIKILNYIDIEQVKKIFKNHLKDVIKIYPQLKF